MTENKLQCFDYLVEDLCEALWALMAIPLSLSSMPVRPSSLRIPNVTVFIIAFSSQIVGAQEETQNSIFRKEKHLQLHSIQEMCSIYIIRLQAAQQNNRTLNCIQRPRRIRNVNPPSGGLSNRYKY